jgi:hypothetical protein
MSFYIPLAVFAIWLCATTYVRLQGLALNQSPTEDPNTRAGDFPDGQLPQHTEHGTYHRPEENACTWLSELSKPRTSHSGGCRGSTEHVDRNRVPTWRLVHDAG